MPIRNRSEDSTLNLFSWSSLNSKFTEIRASDRSESLCVPQNAALAKHLKPAC